MNEVVLIDDHPLFRDGIKQALANSDSFSIVHESDSVASCAEFIDRKRGQLSAVFFIIDISLPDGSGFELLPMISAAGGNLRRCAMLSMHDDYGYAEHALNNKANGYVVKSDDQIHILACLESLLQGETYLSPGVKCGGGANSNKPAGSAFADGMFPAFESLSQRELTILKMVAQGKTSKEISEELFLSQRTVENHRAKICRKLGVSGANALISLAIKYENTLARL